MKSLKVRGAPPTVADGEGTYAAARDPTLREFTYFSKVRR